MRSSGAVMAAGKRAIRSDELPASSIIQPDVYNQREEPQRVFTVGDEVLVTLDCSEHSLRVQSPTVDHTIIMQQKHHQQQRWVLNVNFLGGDFELELVS